MRKKLIFENKECENCGKVFPENTNICDKCGGMKFLILKSKTESQIEKIENNDSQNKEIDFKNENKEIDFKNENKEIDFENENKEIEIEDNDFKNENKEIDFENENKEIEIEDNDFKDEFVIDD